MISLISSHESVYTGSKNVEGERNYEIIQKIGKGNYSTVYLAQINPEEEKNDLVVLKILNLDNSETNFLVEKTILQILGKKINFVDESYIPYIYLLDYGTFVDQNKDQNDDSAQKDPNEEIRYAMVIPYVEGVSLYDYVLQQSATNVCECEDGFEDEYGGDDVKTILVNLVTAFLEIYKAGVIHVDIKPENILINPLTLEITFIDFGMSCLTPAAMEKNKSILARNRLKPSDFRCDKLKGTPIYMAPEIVTAGHISPYSDVYALGIVILFVITRGNDYIYEEEGTIEEILRLVAKPTKRLFMSEILEQSHVPKNINKKKAADFLEKITHYDVNQRLKPKSIMRSLLRIFRF